MDWVVAFALGFVTGAVLLVIGLAVLSVCVRPETKPPPPEPPEPPPQKKHRTMWS